MKSVISHKEPGSRLEFDLPAHFWRGACLDLFSKCERQVSDCIETLRSGGFELDEESQHPGAAARLRSLLHTLKACAFGGHEKVARKILSEYQDLALHRPYLAHGVFAILEDGVEIALSEYQKGRWADHEPRAYTRDEMRTLLAELERATNRLTNQLSQIRAASKAKAA